MLVARLRDVDAQLAAVKSFCADRTQRRGPIDELDDAPGMGEVGIQPNHECARCASPPCERTPGAWRVDHDDVAGGRPLSHRGPRENARSAKRVVAEGGAGFRVWSSRKETRGASWGWFPYSSSRDPRLGGLIPVFTNTPQQRLIGDKEWTTVTHEFELRQPLADLQIQCALQASSGAAWFDLSSLKIRRVSLNVSKSTAKGD